MPRANQANEHPVRDQDVIITKVLDPKLEKAMEVIRTPEPDPFADKWHPAVGQVKRDEQNRVKCEVCHRYLKSSKWRVEHVKHFHPLVAYECRYCADLVFYTIQDLVKHCKINHVSCDHCDSFHRDDNESLQSHISCQHQRAPPQQPPAQPPVATSSPLGADTPKGEAAMPEC